MHIDKIIVYDCERYSPVYKSRFNIYRAYTSIKSYYIDLSDEDQDPDPDPESNDNVYGEYNDFQGIDR
jgi:hypothetical protein